MPGGGVTAAVSRRFCALANAPKMRTNHELAPQLLSDDQTTFNLSLLGAAAVAVHLVSPSLQKARVGRLTAAPSVVTGHRPRSAHVGLDLAAHFCWVVFLGRYPLSKENFTCRMASAPSGFL